MSKRGRQEFESIQEGDTVLARRSNSEPWESVTVIGVHTSGRVLYNVMTATSAFPIFDASNIKRIEGGKRKKTRKTKHRKRIQSRKRRGV